MNQYKDNDGKYAGKAKPKVAEMNGWFELEEGESVYVNSDNESLVSSIDIKGALLLSDRPSKQHQNIDGAWVKLESKPTTNPLEALTLRVEALEKQLKSNNGKAK